MDLVHVFFTEINFKKIFMTNHCFCIYSTVYSISSKGKKVTLLFSRLSVKRKFGIEPSILIPPPYWHICTRGKSPPPKLPPLPPLTFSHPPPPPQPPPYLPDLHIWCLLKYSLQGNGRGRNSTTNLFNYNTYNRFWNLTNQPSTI